MARANSKYFADIIAKLLEAKRKENIIIDDGFRREFRMKFMARAVELTSKSQTSDELRTSDVGMVVGGGTLREELLAGAGLAELRTTQTSDELRMTQTSDELRTSDVDLDLGELPDSAPIDWYGFVKRFRYALALVPSALLVVMASSYVMNLPVGMESDVVVPAQSTQNTPTSDELRTSDVGTGTTSDELRTSDVGLQTDVGALFTEEENGGVVADAIDAELSENMQTSDEVRTSDVVTGETTGVTPKVSTPKTITANGTTKMNQNGSQSESFESQIPDYMQEFYRLNQTREVPVVNSEARVAPIESGVSEAVIAPAEMKVQTSSGGDQAVVLSAPVHYYTNLSDVEKRNLEEIVDHSVDVQAVSEMHVYDISGGVIEVLVQFKDGTSLTKNLRKIGQTSSFDDVTGGVVAPVESDASVNATSKNEEILSVPEVAVPVVERPYVYYTPSGYFGPITYDRGISYERVSR